MRTRLYFEVEHPIWVDVDNIPEMFDVMKPGDTANTDSVKQSQALAVLRDPDLLSSDQVRSNLSQHLAELWDSCRACLDSPTNETFETFRRLCRPTDIMLALRQLAENNREDRDLCSKSW